MSVRTAVSGKTLQSSPEPTACGSHMYADKKIQSV